MNYKNQISDRVKILLIDEDESIFYLIRRVLQRENYRLYTSTSGRSGCSSVVVSLPSGTPAAQKARRMAGVTGWLPVYWNRVSVPRRPACTASRNRAAEGVTAPTSTRFAFIIL